MILRRSGIACLLAFAGISFQCSPSTPSTAKVLDAGAADSNAAVDSAVPPIDVDASTDASFDAPVDVAHDAGPGIATRVRIMGANITSGSQQAYEMPGIRIFKGLAPDIVMLQEFQYKSGTLRALVD